jgi:hypothetical protein
MSKYNGVNVMIEVFKFFSFISLLLTHPLEQLSLADYHGSNSAISFFNGLYYIAPDSGLVKCVVNKGGLFQIILSLDNGDEVVYSGLTETAKKKGDRVVTNEIIGIDNTVSPNTKFILMFYDKVDMFPQFTKKSLTFILDSGTRLYMVADGNVTGAAHYNPDLLADGFYTQVEDGEVVSSSFVSTMAGSFSQIKLMGKRTYVTYCHLQIISVRHGQILKQGDLVAYSGNTGNSLSPRLVLQFEDEELGDDIRVIYYRSSL